MPTEHDLRTAIREYLDHLRVRNYSEATLTTYAWHLEQFRRWCQERGVSEPRQVDEELIGTYQAYLVWYRKANGKPLAEGTRVSGLALLRGFFRRLYRRRLILRDPTRNMQLRQPPLRLPGRGMIERKIEELMAQPDLGTDLGLRDRAILETLYGSGMRRGEVLHLAVSDLDLDGGMVHIRRGKGKKDRIVPLGERACRWLKRYLIEARPVLAHSGQEPVLFLNRYGRPLMGKGLELRLRQYRRRIKVRRKGVCHELRHAMALGMLRNGADIRSIQEILGHARLDVTARYTKVLISDIKAVHKKTHPFG